MPTGYTAPVNDGTITTLRDYALTCARAFGALIEMRDDPFSRPAPRRLPVQDSYHKQQLVDCKLALQRLQDLPEDQRVAECNASNAANSKARQESIEKNTAIANRYNAMLAEVVQWQVPEDLTELRKFMIDQLTESRRFDVSDNPGEYYGDPVAVDVWYADALTRAERDVKYHTEKLAEDAKRAAERQAWLDTLWASLPEEGTTK